MNNLTQRGNYRFDIPDNRLSETFQWQVQTLSIPSVTMETAKVVRSPKLSNTMMAGTGTEYEDMQVTFLIDEDMLSYSELYEWMLTMQNPCGPTTESATNVPRTTLLHILDNTKENTVATFKFHEMYPKALGEVEFNYTETGDLESMTCICTMGYVYFEMIMPDGKVVSPRPV